MRRASLQWLEEVEERYLGGGDLHPEMPGLVSPLVGAVEDGGRRVASRALGWLRWLARSASDRPRPVGDGVIQVGVADAIGACAPRLRLLFERYGGGVEAAALRAVLSGCREPAEAAELAVVLSYVEVNEAWRTWLREYVAGVRLQASIALVAWCLLAAARDSVADQAGDAIGQLSATAPIDHYALWELVEPSVALRAQIHSLPYWQDPGGALDVAVRMLCTAFDPCLSVVQWTYQRGSVTYQFSRRPPAVDPSALSEIQFRTLKAIADSPAVWQADTNVWQVWGLPDSAEALRAVVSQ